MYNIVMKFHIRKLTCPPHLSNVATLTALLCEMQKLADATCQIVSHTFNTSNGSCQSHPRITGEDYYNFG